MLLIAAAILAAPVTGVPKPLEQSKTCPRTTSVLARDRGKAVAPRKLADLPPANVYSTVYRRIGGCEVPVIVKYGVGGR